MTADKFRRMALGMAGAIESSHVGHPDFRPTEKSSQRFITITNQGMVKLTPEQQQEFVCDDPQSLAGKRSLGTRGLHKGAVS